MSKRVSWAIGALVVATIAGSTLLLGNALRMQRQTSIEIRQHFENVAGLRHAQALLVDAETGQRGFLLTNDPSFLEPYDRAHAQLPAELSTLGRMGVDGQDKRLAGIGAAKLDELDLTLALARGGQRERALAVVAGGSGKRLMDGFRAEAARLADREQGQLDAALQRSDRYTLRTYSGLGLLLLAAGALLVIGLRMTLRTRQLETEAVRLREVEQAERRTALIARELNHRVKNLFSVVIAIVQLAGRGGGTGKEAVVRIRERIEALARAHEISLGADPMAFFDLEAMLEMILAPYASSIARLELGGPNVSLPAMRVTPIGLIFHELATNALKYGAWSESGGTVALHWSIDEAQRINGSPAAHMLRLHWKEIRGTPIAADNNAGFGSKLINAAVAQLDGTLTRERGDHGLSIIIDAPIIPARSDRGPANA